MGLLCFVLLWVHDHFMMGSLDLFTHILRDSSLALGRSYDCPSASEVILKYMGKLAGIKPQPNKLKQELCA